MAEDDDEGVNTNFSNSYDLQELGGMTSRLAPHGNDLMGDLIDKNTGGIVFEHTDVSIPGNSSLEVALRRKLRQGVRYDTPYQQGFGDWVLDLPIAYTSYAPNPGTPRSPQFNDGCLTNQGPMHRSRQAAGGIDVLPDQHVSGVTLHVPGKGLSGNLSDPATPEDPKSNWVSAPNTIDNAGRCATVVIASDGTKYKFGRHVFRSALPLTFTYTKRFGGDFGATSLHQTSVRRRYIVYLVTEVEDVNGNWVRYDYTNDSRAELTRIYSNDQREITIQYHNTNLNSSSRNSRQISAVKTNNRSWRYDYTTSAPSRGSLHKVTLPDGRFWRLGTSSLGMRVMSFEVQVDYKCLPREYTFSMKHPDGAIGTFRLRETRHIKNAIDLGSTDDAWDHWMLPLDIPHVADNSKCNDRSNPSQPPFFRDIFWPIYRTLALASKTISGSGIPTAAWRYQYRNYSGGALDNNWTKITGPDGTVQKFTHRAIGLDHGLLKRVDVTPTSGTGESISYDYNVSAPVYPNCTAGGPYGDSTGMCHAFKTRPVTKVTRIRDGNTYTTQTTYKQNSAQRFIDFGYPNRERRYSTVPGSTTARDTVITYEHKTAINVIGLTKRTVQNGRELASYAYDSLGRLKTQTRYGKPYARFTYHNVSPYRGALASVKDANGREFYRTNYKRGIPERMRRSDGVWLSVNVDNNGWMTSYTDAKANTILFQRDNMGRLTLIDPAGNWNNTSIKYNFGGGGVIQTITRGNSRETVIYDKMYRPILERSQALDTGWSSYVNTKYHPAGQVKFTSQPSANSRESKGTNYTYDGLGRLVRKRENFAPHSTEWYRYLSGNRYETTDALGHKTTQFRDGYSGPGEGSLVKTTQPMGVNTILHRNIWGQVTRVQQAGNHNGFPVNQSQFYYYDSSQRLCRYRTPEGGDTLNQYDASGYLVSYAKGMGSGTACAAPSGPSKVTLTRDALKQVIKTDFTDPNTSDIQKTYDLNGNVVTSDRNGVNWTYTYDELNHLTSEHLDVDGRTYDIDYEYDKNENLVQRIFPSGRMVKYTVDGLGRHKSALSNGVYYARNISYHPSKHLSSMRYGNGQVFTQTLNSRLLPQRLLTQKVGSKALDLKYTYDARGFIKSMNNGSDLETYGYDALGRLATANGSWGLGVFIYDPLGNLRSKTLGSRQVNVSYDNVRNRAIRSTDTAGSTRNIAYDSRGNVSTLGKLSFGYDYSDQPTSLTGSSYGNYVYDANLKRVKVSVDGKTIYNIYDASGSLIHVDKQNSGDVTLIPYKQYLIPVRKQQKTDYIKVAGMSVARISDDETTYLHPNHLGSAITGTSSLGSVTWREKYLPYGEKLIDAAANRDLDGFTGHIDDSATGLTYMQARYYDPVIGRFLSVDPVGVLEGGAGYFNRYAYVLNDPINGIDPTGTSCFSFGSGSCSVNDILARAFGYQSGAEANERAPSDFAENTAKAAKQIASSAAEATHEGSVVGLRAVEKTSGKVGTALSVATIASAKFPGTQPFAVPLAKAAGVATLISSGTGVAADLIEGSPDIESAAGAIGVVTGKLAEKGAKKFVPHHTAAAIEVSVKEATKATIKKLSSDE